MFDWARGSTLKALIQHHVPMATYDPWLKGWAYGWLCALLDVPAGCKVLDVGCGSNPYFADYFVQKQCEAHGMDAPSDPTHPGWGISPETMASHPNITFHLGLAGQEIGPAGYFDLITCVSTMEHIYESTPVFEPTNPFRHFDTLHDMVRMLKPGGVLALTYDFYLNDIPHNRGWDYLADIELLRAADTYLITPQREPRSRTYVYNYEDTLFMAPEGVLSYSDRYYRLTGIGMIFRKGGAVEGPVRLSPHPDLIPYLFPYSELAPEYVAQPTVVQGQLVKDTKTVDLIKLVAQRIRTKIRKH